MSQYDGHTPDIEKWSGLWQGRRVEPTVADDRVSERFHGYHAGRVCAFGVHFRKDTFWQRKQICD